MTTIKALQGASHYSVGIVVYGIVLLYPQGTLLEIQLLIILITAGLILISHSVTRLHKWFDFATLVNLLLVLPVIVYLTFNRVDPDIFNKFLLSIFIVSILSKLSVYVLNRAGFVVENEELTQLHLQKIAHWLLAWAGLSSLLATLIYWCIKALFPEAFF
ncbi:hypothetical protein [Arundinibacter roseus]|uniref:Uncharacterized protein n=1 Tax=Arundinibacter roseus TaxID=2070510 RepID=A0A4R4K7A6_9BACT|nr:hypothetical protein [Arundinibacter roseus]TDB63340.1 hypothetical protein EZE20_16335 [Arundinibacter roseus]